MGIAVCISSDSAAGNTPFDDSFFAIFKVGKRESRSKRNNRSAAHLLSRRNRLPYNSRSGIHTPIRQKKEINSGIRRKTPSEAEQKNSPRLPVQCNNTQL